MNKRELIKEDLEKKGVIIDIPDRPYDSGGQKEVYFATINNEVIVLKIVNVTPVYMYDELEINGPFSIDSLDSETKEIIDSQINYLARRIKTEILMGKECSFMPKLRYLDDIQLIFDGYNFYLYYIEEKIAGSRLNYNSCNYTMRQIIDFGEQMILQIAEMKNKGYVHRDIKPKNIIYTPEINKYTIIDGGICKNLNDEIGNTIAIVEHLGTRGYSAPEQINVTPNYNWDFRTDIYPVGIIMIEMLNIKWRGKFDIIKDIENFKNLWDDEYVGQVEMKRFFNDVIVKLIHPKRFRRFIEIENFSDCLITFKEEF